MELIPNIELHKYSTMSVGGSAKGLYVIEKDEDVPVALDAIKKMGAEPCVVGEGSNMYFGDGPHENLVLLSIAIKGIEVKPSVIEGKVLTVGAGEHWDDVVQRAAKEGVWGIESLAGIPGTAGAAPIQNIGAYGSEVADCIEAVEVYDRELKEVRGIPARLCGFGYRSSIFNGEARNRYIILRVRLWLHKKMRRQFPKEVVVPKDGKIVPGAVGDQIRAIRAQKLPDYHEFPNCGSFFKNPVIDVPLAEKLLREYPTMPQFPVGAAVKLSAAWLIQEAGMKGRDWGNVAVSAKHALVLTTNGKATAREVKDAVAAIVSAVQKKFGVTLTEEPNYVA